MRKTTRLILGLAAVALLTGCIPPGYAEESNQTDRPKYTDEEVAAYKTEFASISEWPVPDNPDSLVDYGVKICDVIDAAGVEVAKDSFKDQAESKRDWQLTEEVARAATATLCSEYKGQWEQALPLM